MAKSKPVTNINDLTPDMRNANKGTQRGRGMVEASLREVGAGRSIVVDKDGRVIAGNKTLEAAADIGLEIQVVHTTGDRLVVVQRDDLDLSDDTGPARKLAYLDNRASDVGLAWDAEQLLADLNAGFSFNGIFDTEELDAMLAGLVAPEPVNDTPPDVSKADELQKKWQTQTGQIWQLGKHRLAVGDCTDAATVARLMQGEKAQLMVTSPPYNQGIDAFKPSGMHKEGDWVAKVGRLAYSDSMPEDKYQDWQREFLRLWFDFIADNGSVFYNHKNRYREKQVVSPMAWLPGPFKLRQEIIWSRPGSVTQNARMFLPSDERIYWMYKGNDFYFDDSTRNKTWSTVWDIGLETNKDHAVGFPVELPWRAITSCSNAHEIVAEPFNGSGTTLIACEQLSRQCRAIEFDAGYCAITLQRFQDATGQTPVLIS